MTAKDGMQRLRDERRAHGVCTICGLAKPERGRKNCRACLDQVKVWNAKYRINNIEHIREQQIAQNARTKVLREERKKKHICVICGKNKPNAWRVTCENCLEKRRLQEIRREMRKDS